MYEAVADELQFLKLLQAKKVAASGEHLECARLPGSYFVVAAPSTPPGRRASRGLPRIARPLLERSSGAPHPPIHAPPCPLTNNHRSHPALLARAPLAGGYHLWGQSFGGLLAVLVALDAPKGSIASCVLTSPAMANELDCALNFVKARDSNYRHGSPTHNHESHRRRRGLRNISMPTPRAEMAHTPIVTTGLSVRPKKGGGAPNCQLVCPQTQQKSALPAPSPQPRPALSS
jgi:hypothetical protein